MFKTETHLHTSEASRCGRLTAAEQMKYYSDGGYSTVFVSDHFDLRFTSALGDMPWEEKIDAFLVGYRAARAAGEPLGITVLPSAEVELTYFKNHYLIYGDVEAFLKRHENICELPLEEFYRIAHGEGILVVQAHPHRDGACYPTPELVDGLEVYNSNPRHEDFSPRTLALAREHGKHALSGSDAHRPQDVCRAGILTRERVDSAETFLKVIRSGDYDLIREAGKVYVISDPHGKRDFEGLNDYLAMAGEGDLLIILGDVFFGCEFGEGDRLREYNEWFKSLDKNIAFIDGNHENYAHIATYPEEEWCGGRVRRISEHIVYLKRGEIYDIGGRSVFTFGGCKSSAKWHEEGMAYEGEDPTPEEVARGIAALERVGNKVDFVLTHKHERGIDPTVSEGLMELTSYIEGNVEYKRWYYGHWHTAKDVDEKHRIIYKELRELR